MNQLKKISALLLLLAVFCLQQITAQVSIPKFNEKTEYGWVLKFTDQGNGDWDWKNKEYYESGKLICWFERKDQAPLNMEKFIWEFVNLNTGKPERWEQECYKSDKSVFDNFELPSGKYICLVRDAKSGMIIGRSEEINIK